MNIFARQHNACWEDISQAFGKKIEDVTREDFLSIIPKTRYDSPEVRCYPSNITFNRDFPDKKRKWWQRINLLWVVPILVFIFLPLQWIVTGEWGLQSSSKIGEFIFNLVGE